MTKYHTHLLIWLLLTVAASASAQPGGWSVNTAQYQYSMTAVAQIKVDGVPNHLLNNYLAVYSQGQLRGYATPLRLNGQAYYFLNLYSNVYKDEVLYFRAYLGADQKIYESAMLPLFKHHKALGKMAEPYQIDLTLGEGPLLYSQSEVNYVAGTCPDVLDVQASDNLNTEGNGLTYSIIGGADQGKFTINTQTGVLSWLNFTPNVDAPGDADGNNRYEVQVRVRDAAAQTDEQLVTVTVVKFAPPPALSCPANLTVRTSDDGVGNCTTPAIGTEAPAGTLCESRQLGYQLSGATTGSGIGQVPVNQNFEKGITTVTYTRSGAGAGQCIFTVTVVDDEFPLLTCPGNLTRNTDPNQCTAVVTYSVTATDNCPGSALTWVGGLVSGQAFPKGLTVVRWRVTDAVGQSVNCTFAVTVTDAQAPAISCPANVVRSTDPGLCTAVVSYTSATFSDNCSSANVVRTSGPASGSAFPKGVTVVTWQATDAVGASVSCSFSVTVNDTQLPTITCPTNISKPTDPNLCTAAVTYANPTFTDNCVGAFASRTSGLGSGAAFQKGSTAVTWQVTDGAGLTKTCAFTVTVTDAQLPTITCPSNQSKSTDLNKCTGLVTYAPPTATDNCNGTTLLMTSGLASGSAFPKGQTTVVWRATDGAGLTKTCSFRVTVNDAQTPAVTCPAGQSLNTGGGLCTAVATYTTPTFTDNCAGGSVTRTGGLASGSAFPKGSTVVTWKATDAVGLTKTCSFTITVADAQLPTITCPSNISVTAAPGQCTKVVTYTNPTATDNCGITSNILLSGLASGSTFPQGITTNVWRATDNSGLTKTCAFTVTVACGSASEQGAGSREQLAEISADKQQLITMNLAPNPATTQVLVTVEGLGENGGEITIFDAQGHVVRQQSKVLSPTSNINVADLPAGLYFVTLRSAGTVLTKRLVKAE